jgi:hypothetical protein
LEQNITNLSLYEAYQIIKPPTVPVNNRWHLMMYNAVVERIDLLEPNTPLLVAWEEEEAGTESYYHYISKMSSSSQ